MLEQAEHTEHDDAITDASVSAIGDEGTADSAGGTARRDIIFGVVVSAICIVLGLAIYSNVITDGIFVFDDFEYILGNPMIQDLSSFFQITDPRFIGYLSFAVNYAVHGEDPYGYHVVNVAIHIFNAILVFYLVQFLSGLFGGNAETGGQPDRSGFFSRKNTVAMLTSLIFLSHPLETQAVSYLTQRFTSLSSCFYLLSVVCYLEARTRYERQQGGAVSGLTYGIAILSTILAMRTKEIAFTIPFLLLCIEFLVFTGSTFGKRRFYFLIPFFATLMIIPLSLFGPEYGLMGHGTGVDETTRRDKLFDLFQRSPYEYLVTQFRVIITYIRLMLLPVHQLAVYDFRASKSFFEPAVMACFTALALLAAAGVWSWLRARAASASRAADYRLVAFGILWFFITLSIESSVIPIKDVIFEHRAYLPSVGFFAVVSTLLLLACENILTRASAALRVGLLAAVIVIPLSIATYMRNVVWTDEVIFWDDIVQKTGKAIGYNNRGNAYLKMGRYDLAVIDLTTTIGFFPNAMDRMAWENADFTPTNMAKTYMSRANAYGAMGDIEHAQADMQMARRVMMPW